GDLPATVPFAGSLAGRTETMPLAVFLALESDRDAAIALSLVLVAVSLAVLVPLRDRWLGGRTRASSPSQAPAWRPAAGGPTGAAAPVRADPPAGTCVAPADRPIGVVFQDYLLFPRLSALDNVAFGLRARGARKAEARAEAAGWLDRVGLAAHTHARPRALSGGQAQ